MKSLIARVYENLNGEKSQNRYQLELAILEKNVKKQRLVDQFIVANSFEAKMRLKNANFIQNKIMLICDLSCWFHEQTIIPNLPRKQQYAHLDLELSKCYPNYQNDWFYHHQRLENNGKTSFISTLVSRKAIDDLLTFIKTQFINLELFTKVVKVMINPGAISALEAGNNLVIGLNDATYQVQLFTNHQQIGFYNAKVLQDFNPEMMRLEWMRLMHGILPSFTIDKIILYFDQTLPEYREKQYLEILQSIYSGKITVVHERWYQRKANLSCFHTLVKYMEDVINREKDYYA